MRYLRVFRRKANWQKNIVKHVENFNNTYNFNTSPLIFSKVLWSLGW
jgi:hypothetical protein